MKIVVSIAGNYIVATHDDHQAVESLYPGTITLNKPDGSYSPFTPDENGMPQPTPYTPTLEEVQGYYMDQADTQTDVLLAQGVVISDVRFPLNIDVKAGDYMLVYKAAIEMIMATGMAGTVKGFNPTTGKQQTLTVQPENAQAFLVQGAGTFNAVSNDGWIIKLNGGTLSTGQVVPKALQDMTLEELEVWFDPRLPAPSSSSSSSSSEEPSSSSSSSSEPASSSSDEPGPTGPSGLTGPSGPSSISGATGPL